MSDDFDPTQTLISLNSALSIVETDLSQLHARPLTETREGLGSLERAKLNLMISYAIHDLVWGECFLRDG